MLRGSGVGRGEQTWNHDFEMLRPLLWTGKQGASSPKFYPVSIHGVYEIMTRDEDSEGCGTTQTTKRKT